MPSPCNNLNVAPIKVSQLVRYSNIDVTDYFLTIESGSALYSRKSTFGDLINSFKNVTGSYSGSFSGSYWGKIISKNTTATGSFRGTNSHFTGNNKFSGSLYGTSSAANTAILAESASYLLQSTNTTNQLGYFNGTRLVSTPGLYFQNNVGGAKALYISSSLSFNYLIVASRGRTDSGTKYNVSGVTLANYNSGKSYPNYDAWTIASATSGSLTFIAPIGSNAFSSSTIKAHSTSNECYGMVQRRNGFYFWPYMNSNTPSRDGGIGIGVQPPVQATGSFAKYLRAKLQIDMFSGSGEGPWSVPATVEHRSTAILVNYGSGSITSKTFYVSASGNTYIKGNLRVNGGITGSVQGTGFKTLNGKSVSFWGTSSNAVSASYALSASYVSNGLNNGIGGLGSGLFISSISTNTLQVFSNGTGEGGVGDYCFAVSHGFGQTPSLIKAVLICISNDSNYLVDDELAIESCFTDTNSGDEEISIIVNWANSTYVGCTVGTPYFGGTNVPIYVHNKFTTTGGVSRILLDKSKWKIKIRAWK